MAVLTKNGKIFYKKWQSVYLVIFSKWRKWHRRRKKLFLKQKLFLVKRHCRLKEYGACAKNSHKGRVFVRKILQGQSPS
jgi:hypothetical protein